jgi:hypothetical protein
MLLKSMTDKTSTTRHIKMQSKAEYSRVKQSTAEYSRVQQSTAEYSRVQQSSIVLGQQVRGVGREDERQGD